MDKLFNTFTSEEEKLQLSYNCLDFERMMTLLEMAKVGQVPDGSFSDFEVSVWSKFRSIIA